MYKRQQLEDRLQKKCAERARILPRNTSATSSPTVEVAMELAKEAYNPRLTLEHWIEQGAFAPSIAMSGVKSIDDIKEKKITPNKTCRLDTSTGRRQCVACI